ncbi:hypothetical protein ACIPSE_31700 [Streptomyces sp. NPDC090106]|uniref:hypothetical protein n=1 Tax=Streptomyces sp. NPDC090106 TaxID=3365946 RepID=UPI00381C37AD
MQPEEEARIVESLAKFYDYVVEKGGKNVPEYRIAEVVSEAALIDYETTCRYLPRAIKFSEKTLESVISIHRQRIMMAEYYATNPPAPQNKQEADDCARYTLFYRIGLDRGCNECFAPRVAPYPTATEVDWLHESRFRQYATLGYTEFAQPEKLSRLIPRLAAPAPQAPPPAPPGHQQVPVVPSGYRQVPVAQVNYDHIPPDYRPLSNSAPHSAPHPAPRAAAPLAGPHPSAAAWHPAASHGHGAHPPAGVHAPYAAVPRMGGPYGGTHFVHASQQHYGARPAH